MLVVMRKKLKQIQFSLLKVFYFLCCLRVHCFYVALIYYSYYSVLRFKAFILCCIVMRVAKQCCEYYNLEKCFISIDIIHILVENVPDKKRKEIKKHELAFNFVRRSYKYHKTPNAVINVLRRKKGTRHTQSML